MKKLLAIIVVSAILAVSTQSVLAQSAKEAKEIYKERQAIKKLSKSELTQKSSKQARQEARNYKKVGWLVSPGALPIEKQLERAYTMQFEYDENMFPKYIMAEAQSIGENYDAAKRQALMLAIENIAAQIQTEVIMIAENTVANQQMSAGDAASIVQTVSGSKNVISQSIGRTIPVMEVYRETKNKNKEVLVRLAYNGEMAKEAAKKAIRNELEKKGDKLHEQLDKMLGF